MTSHEHTELQHSSSKLRARTFVPSRLTSSAVLANCFGKPSTTAGPEHCSISTLSFAFESNVKTGWFSFKFFKIDDCVEVTVRQSGRFVSSRGGTNLQGRPRVRGDRFRDDPHILVRVFLEVGEELEKIGDGNVALRTLRNRLGNQWIPDKETFFKK